MLIYTSYDTIPFKDCFALYFMDLVHKDWIRSELNEIAIEFVNAGRVAVHHDIQMSCTNYPSY